MPKIMPSADLFTQFFNAFGKELMPTWVCENLPDSKQTHSQSRQLDVMTSVTQPLFDMNMRGLEAFILLGACKTDYWHRAEPQIALKPCVETDFLLDQKSRTLLLTINTRILDSKRFSECLAEFGEECRRYFNAGQTPDVDTMLDLFTSQLANEYSDNAECNIELAQSLSIFGNLYGALETYDRTNMFDSFICDDFIRDNGNGDLRANYNSNSINRCVNWAKELDDDFSILMDAGVVPPLNNMPSRNKLWHPEMFSDKPAPVFVRYAVACDKGNKDARQLIEQLTFMSISRGFQTASITRFPTLTEVNEGKILLPEITGDLLLASVYGAPLVLKKLAEQLGMSINQVRFPTMILELRKALNELHMLKKTFSSDRIEGTFFHHAQVLKSKVSFELSIRDLTEKLFVRAHGADQVTLNYALLAELVHKYQHELTPQTARQKASRFKAYLVKKVVGQHEALECAADMYFKAIHPRKGQARNGIDSLTLVGANQSGKSLLAYSFVDALNEEDKQLGYDACCLSMENYSDDKCVMQLFGSGAQYVDSALGLLTLTAEVNPRTCFVFENFEKAHPKVQDALLTLLDVGEAIDQTSNRRVNFKQCFFIFTTSVGASQLSNFCL
jgi:hypothetical protein